MNEEFNNDAKYNILPYKETNNMFNLITTLCTYIF